MLNLQKQVADFCNQHNLGCSPERRALDLLSEMGEVAKEILKSSNYGRAEFVASEAMSLELGDVMFSLIALANEMEINLESALNMALGKYEKRLKSHGSIDS